MTDEELNEIRDRFEDRVADMFRAEAGNPFVPAAKRPPLSPGRGSYVRHYSFSVVEFATRCFTLNEQLEEANVALLENAQHYLDNPEDLHDRDSYHWHSEMLCRLIEYYGPDGSLHAGRLTLDTEEKILESLWVYANAYSLIDDRERSGVQPRIPATTSAVAANADQTWHIRESENHHVQIFSTLWHFAKLAKNRPAFASRMYGDGHTAEEHYAAWTDYVVAYCRERARKGLFVEMANDGYNGCLLKGVYNFYDFAEDQHVKDTVGCLLDLYWATWAQEQLDGVAGGGKARIYQGGGDRVTGGRHVQHLAWFYLGIGSPSDVSSVTLSALTSRYRLPAVVMDLALDTEGRGVYVVHQRPLGLVEEEYYRPPDYRMRTDFGGIHRYSYCTPEFVMGTPMLEARPLEDWAMISSQNRWHGVIFAGHKNTRIVPQCRAEDGKVTYNQQWSVQKKGSLITQKLKTCRACGPMQVWFSEPGLDNRLEDDGWVFVEAGSAYAAVRVVTGGHSWEASDDAARGDWLVCADEWTPVIVEVATRRDVPDYESFRNKVKALTVLSERGVLKYTGLSGERITFYTDYAHPPEINETPVDYAPPNVFDSPFVQSEWNSGVVTIQKGDRRIVRDFNSDPE